MQHVTTERFQPTRVAAVVFDIVVVAVVATADVVVVVEAAVVDVDGGSVTDGKVGVRCCYYCYNCIV